MKLIIEISEADYTKVKYGRAPVAIMREAIRNGAPLSNDQADKNESFIPFMMHRELDIPISDCMEAYNIALEHLRSKARVKG